MWALESSRKFSAKSLYKLIKDSGTVDLRMTELWKMKLPLIKIFIWMLWHNRVLTGEQMKIRKSKKSERCKYCGKLETRNHLFFNCNIAQVIWVWVSISLRWSERPTSVQHYEDMMKIGLDPIRNNEVFFFVIASMFWSLRKTRNDWVFNNTLINSPKAIAHKIFGLLSQWKKLMKPEKERKMEDTIQKLQEGQKAW